MTNSTHQANLEEMSLDLSVCLACMSIEETLLREPWAALREQLCVVKMDRHNLLKWQNALLEASAATSNNRNSHPKIKALLAKFLESLAQARRSLTKFKEAYGHTFNLLTNATRIYEMLLRQGTQFDTPDKQFIVELQSRWTQDRAFLEKLASAATLLNECENLINSPTRAGRTLAKDKK